MTTPWSSAQRALSALAVGGAGLGGMTIRARPGPVRQTLESQLAALPLPLCRITPGIDDRQLFGGVNVAASLAAGGVVFEKGIADLPASLVLTMAERAPAQLAARLSQLMDSEVGHILVLLDEGAEPEEAAPSRLTERLAFYCDLSELRSVEAVPCTPAPADLDRARAFLTKVTITQEQVHDLVVLAARFGIDSPRAVLFALSCARALAALDESMDVTDDHLREAASLVYPSRVALVPADEQPEPESSDSTTDNTPDDRADHGETEPEILPSELLVDAVSAMVPADILTRIEAARRAGRQATANGSGAGKKTLGNRRGRPLPPRPGKPGGRNRIDVIATLRTAAPWQKLRRGEADATRLIVRPSDIRLKRYEDRSDRLLIFAVDASGSSAMTRMAEAKGAIELLLAQAYAKRDQVALVAFRGEGADVLLPPTRSLVQAKRRISALPGGGGTPLAAGLRMTIDLARHGQRAGLSPSLVLLTDGRGNISLSGQAGRKQARDDSKVMALHIASRSIPAVVIDTAPRPGPESAELAQWLQGHYLPLPRADAHRISAAADTALFR